MMLSRGVTTSSLRWSVGWGGMKGASEMEEEAGGVEVVGGGVGGIGSLAGG